MANNIIYSNSNIFRKFEIEVTAGECTSNLKMDYPFRFMEIMAESYLKEHALERLILWIDPVITGIHATIPGYDKLDLYYELSAGEQDIIRYCVTDYKDRYCTGMDSSIIKVPLKSYVMPSLDEEFNFTEPANEDFSLKLQYQIHVMLEAVGV